MRTLSSDRSDEDRSTGRRPSRRRWLLAAAIGGLTLAAIGVFTVLQMQPSQDVVAPTTEPTDLDPATEPTDLGPELDAARIADAVALAEAYIDARNAYDSARARELVADDLSTSEYPDGWQSTTNIELAFEFHRAYGFEHLEVDCTPEGDTAENQTPDPIKVRCDYLWDSELHRTGNFPPSPTSVTITVEDGQITRVARGPVRTDELPASARTQLEFWNRFVTFVAIEDADFSDVVHRSLQLEPEATQELIERLPEYFERYEEWVEAQED